MANLGKNDGIYHIRFRYQGREFKKSLKIRVRGAANAAKNLVELTIHRLTTGQIAVPEAVEVSDFILSGGTLLKPIVPANPVASVQSRSTKELIEGSKLSQKNLLAESYHDSQALHLRHVVRHLGSRADAPCSQVTFRDLVPGPS